MPRSVLAIIALLLSGVLAACGGSPQPAATTAPAPTTVSAAPSPSLIPTAAPTSAPSATPVPSATAAPTTAPSATAAPTTAPSATAASTAAASPTATPSPTAGATAQASATAAQATAAPSATPVPASPTAPQPTEEPTAVPPTAAPPTEPVVSGAERGLQVYTRMGCGGCHALSAAGTSGSVGPSHDGVGGRAGQRIQDGSYTGQATSAAGYLRESITNPGVYIVPGYESVVMPPFNNLSAEDLDALVQMLLQQ